MKKYFQNNFRASENLELKQRQNKQNKTTDINILLNRVKLDRKKNFSKKNTSIINFSFAIKFYYRLCDYLNNLKN